MVNRMLPISGFTGETQKITCSDTATALTTPTVASLAPIGALITVEDNACRVAFGVNPSIAPLGHKLNVGQSFRLYSPQECSSLRHVNATAGSNAVIMATYYYAN
jgi:hypothetical protein